MNASISSINAYKQAVVSAQSSLDAMEAGYSVGTRTIVDVLDATTTLYNILLRVLPQQGGAHSLRPCGLYEAKINGKRVGEFIFAPGSTDYW